MYCGADGNVTKDETMYVMFYQFTGFTAGNHYVKFTLPTYTSWRAHGGGASAARRDADERAGHLSAYIQHLLGMSSALPHQSASWPTSHAR